MFFRNLLIFYSDAEMIQMFAFDLNNIEKWHLISELFYVWHALFFI